MLIEFLFVLDPFQRTPGGWLKAGTCYQLYVDAQAERGVSAYSRYCSKLQLGG